MSSTPEWTETTYTVCSHFLSAIFNGDDSGLGQGDRERLEAWYAAEGFDLRKGHFGHDSDQEPRFARCDIVGLMGDVVDIVWNERTEGGRS